MASKNMGQRNREVGRRWERRLVELFRPYFPNLERSHNCNALRDSEKVDLAHKDESEFGRFPINVQAKCTYGSIAYKEVLSELPRKPGIINVVAHRRTSKAPNGDFVVRGEFVFMTMEDFMSIVDKVYGPPKLCTNGTTEDSPD